MARKALVLLVGGYVAVLGVLAISLYNASPGPVSQEILGVGIGRHDQNGGIAYLSGRHLRCARPKDQPAGSATCQVEIAGRSLMIRAQRNRPTHPNQLGGRCEAFYAGKQWPCRVDSAMVQVHWFAFLDKPLGLDKDQLDILRREYFLENLPESTFIDGIEIVSIVNTVLALVLVGVWLWPRVRRKFFCVLTATTCAMATGVVSFFLTMFLTSGFWD